MDDKMDVENDESSSIHKKGNSSASNLFTEDVSQNLKSPSQSLKKPAHSVEAGDPSEDENDGSEQEELSGSDESSNDEQSSDQDQEELGRDDQEMGSLIANESIEPFILSVPPQCNSSSKPSTQTSDGDLDDLDELLPPKLVINYPFHEEDHKSSSTSIVNYVKSRKSKNARHSKQSLKSTRNIPGPLNPQLVIRPLMDAKPEYAVEPGRGQKPNLSSESIHFPPKTMRRIMYYLTGAHDIRVSHPSVRAISVAMECFIQEYAKEAFQHSQRKGRNVIRYDDIAYVGNHFSSLFFLQDYLPPVKTAADAITTILANAGVPADADSTPVVRINLDSVEREASGKDGTAPHLSCLSSDMHISSFVRSALEIRKSWDEDSKVKSSKGSSHGKSASRKK